MFEPLAIWELLAFNAQKIGGDVTLTQPSFREFFSGVMPGGVMFAPLAILAKRGRGQGHVTPNFLGVKCQQLQNG